MCSYITAETLHIIQEESCHLKVKREWYQVELLSEDEGICITISISNQIPPICPSQPCFPKVRIPANMLKVQFQYLLRGNIIGKKLMENN